jgi:hypothetical protein
VACDDGGVAADRALAVVPWDLIDMPAEGETRRSRLELAAAELSEEGADRLEARAYAETADLVERLGSRGSARSLSRALERELAAR